MEGQINTLPFGLQHLCTLTFSPLFSLTLFELLWTLVLNWPEIYINVFKFNTDGLMHWEKDKETPPTPPGEFLSPYYRAPAADIEMTAYALMTYVLLAEDDPSLIGQAMPIVRWLTKQRNALGGFASTQVSRHRVATLCLVFHF